MSLNFSGRSDSQKKGSKSPKKRGKVKDDSFPRTSTPLSGIRPDLLRTITRTVHTHSAPNSPRNSPMHESFRQSPHARSLPGSMQNTPNASRESSPGTDFRGKKRKGRNRGGKTSWSKSPGQANTSRGGADDSMTDWNKNVKGWNTPKDRSQSDNRRNWSKGDSHSPKYKSPKGFQTSYRKKR